MAAGGLGKHVVLEYGQFLTDMDYAYDLLGRSILYTY